MRCGSTAEPGEVGDRGIATYRMLKHASNHAAMLLPVAFTLLALPLHTYSQSASKATIVRKRIVIVRSGKFAKDFPDRKRATISYPFVTGLRDAVVLRKVRSLLSVGNVFETSIKEYRENNWLDEFDYVVNYNANNILDVTFTQNGMAAYPDSQSRTISIDLRTGSAIKASDLLVEARLPELARLVDGKMKEGVGQII